MNQKVELFGIKFDNLTIEEVKNFVVDFIKSGQKGYVVTPNAFHIVMLRKDEEFRKAYEKAKLVLADGVSIIFSSKILGKPLKERCAGADLFIEICKIAAHLNKNIFLLGGTAGSEKIAEQKLKILFPNINVVSYSPPFGFENDEEENNKIVEMINNSNACVLFICVGAPKGEKWLCKNIDRLKISLAFPFGAALDFFAGTKKRAPKWMQKIGLEWFWRLIQEPKRLWKRYLIGNTIFIFLVIEELIKKILKRKND